MIRLMSSTTSFSPRPSQSTWWTSATIIPQTHANLEYGSVVSTDQANRSSPRFLAIYLRIQLGKELLWSTALPRNSKGWKMPVCCKMTSTRLPRRAILLFVSMCPSTTMSMVSALCSLRISSIPWDVWATPWDYGSMTWKTKVPTMNSAAV